MMLVKISLCWEAKYSHRYWLLKGILILSLIKKEPTILILLGSSEFVKKSTVSDFFFFIYRSTLIKIISFHISHMQYFLNDHSICLSLKILAEFCYYFLDYKTYIYIKSVFLKNRKSNII